MKFYWSLFSALVLTTTTTNHLSSAQKPNETGVSSLEEWPRVYEAVIAAPGTETQLGSDDTRFASDIDFLDITETGLPSPFDGTGTDFMRVSFLVHSEEEMKHLVKLTVENPLSDLAAHSAGHASHLELNTDLTFKLQQESKPSTVGASQVQQQLDFETINGFECYKNVAGSYAWLEHMVARASSIPGLSITLSDIGDSYLKTQNSNNGYDIKLLKVSGNGVANVPGRTTEKGIFFLMTGIHARELAPPELVSRWIEGLVDGYGNDAESTAILDHTEFHYVIHANPDGRNEVENNLDGYRRKNLNPSASNSCGLSSLGVDLNRNFPFKWGLNSGSSNNKCDQTYRGLFAGSESEVQAIVNYCESIFPEGQRKPDPEGDKQVAFPDTAKGIFMDTHSYSEIIIWPWGHEELATGNDSQFEALVAKYRHFNGYGFSGPGNGFLYEASGATDDWAYGVLGAAGFTFELGTTFYQSCSYFENDILPKNIPALTYAAKSTTAPYRIPKGPDVTSVTTEVVNGGNSLVVTADASDSAYSSNNHPSSQQGVSEVRTFVNIHPYDLQNGQAPVGEVLSNQQSITIDISGLDYGRHTVYVQAEDEDGFIGPVTAAYFIKNDPNNPFPTASPTTAAPAPAPCTDDPENWYDSDGPQYDCDWYAQGNNCAQYGDSFENDGKTANEACCGCGGGLTGTPAPVATDAPTKSPTPKPVASPTDAPTTSSPTKVPTASPTPGPVASPTDAPTTSSPTKVPTASPTPEPVVDDDDDADDDDVDDDDVDNDDDATSPNWIVLDETGFENDTTGPFTNLGNKHKQNNPNASYEGSSFLRIKKTGKAKTDWIGDLSNYSKFEVKFWFKATNTEDGDAFSAEVKFRGGDWTNVGTYTSGTDFDNNSWQEGRFESPILQNRLKFRFIMNGDQGNDRVDIDNVVMSGLLL